MNKQGLRNYAFSDTGFAKTYKLVSLLHQLGIPLQIQPWTNTLNLLMFYYPDLYKPTWSTANEKSVNL